MGLLDRVKAAFSGRGEAPEEEPVEPVVDVDARRAQLEELERALRELGRVMADDRERMANPGWSGRVADIRFVAGECANLSGKGFDRAALLDLAAEVPFLYRRGAVPPEYGQFQVQHDRVVAAVESLRASLPSETGRGTP